MEVTQSLVEVKKISWASVISGVLTALSISVLLSILGTGLALAMVDPLNENIDNGASTLILIWTGISIVISLGVGAFVSGKLSSSDGFIHGFLVWATSLIIAIAFSFMTASAAVKVAGSLLSGMYSATASVLSGATSIAGEGVQGLSGLSEKIYDNIDSDISIDYQSLQSNALEALKKSKIPSLQPDYIQKQLNGAKQDITVSLKELAIEPNNASNIIQGAIDKLQERSKAVTVGVDRDSLVDALSDNSDMTKDEINQAVDNIFTMKDKANKLLNNYFDEVNNRLNSAMKKYNDVKQKALEQTAAATSALAKVALWTFFALLIAAVTCGIMGNMGTNYSKKYN